MEPENTGPAIIDYDVQYREGDSGDGFTDAQHQGTARTATLTGLMPDTVYEVQVRATNATRTGDWSESGEEKTKALQTGDQIYYFPHLGPEPEFASPAAIWRSGFPEALESRARNSRRRL